MAPVTDPPPITPSQDLAPDEKNKSLAGTEDEIAHGEAEATRLDDDIIDHITFDQLLEMDDDEDREFSRSIVWNYFEQVESTVRNMDEALKSKKLDELSHLGHFLKGSSAALGLNKVKASCEKIQNIGNLKNDLGTATIDEEEALRLITQHISIVKRECQEAEKYLRRFYKDE
ncbi:uncharacterized protein VTP21DRAFT_7026 [Calcarisporiella thermophila]|uniref:uncharacterized protein n=1 Tax=Calcarisporiella thermophila TaxID=911321 RepID=UPI00374283AF